MSGTPTRTANPSHRDNRRKWPGIHVIRCWESNPLTSPLRLIQAVHECKPDVVWFNLVYSTFATPEYPVAAFAGFALRR